MTDDWPSVRRAARDEYSNLLCAHPKSFHEPPARGLQLATLFRIDLGIG
jgi:hypothetical protein